MTQTVLLSIDTSTEFCSVALLRAAAGTDRADAVQTWVRHERTGAVSSARVLPAVREVLEEAGLTLGDCAAIAFGAGPGSFTGLRTAAGIVQGLAFGLTLPVMPVSTLLACAESARLQVPTTARVLAALDARMGEIYWADYVWEAQLGEWRIVRPATLSAPDAVMIPTEPFTLAGPAVQICGEHWPVRLRAQTVAAQARPHALPIAHLGWRAYQAARTVPAERAVPEYVRDKVAQTTAERLAARASTDGRGSA